MSHTFGGNWTEEKLAVMQRYFTAYARALKNQHFNKWYVDAFAGTGERSESKQPLAIGSLLFGEDAGEVGEVKDGSARIALAIDPPFDRYVFVDLNEDHAAALKELQTKFPARNIDVLTGDANEVLTTLCQTTSWLSTRAAVFIDPYGMQVSWATLEALARTKAVDIALLFPTGPLNRMLAGHGNIPPEWAKRIDDHLGPCDWRGASYQKTLKADLFAPNVSTTKKTINVEGLRRFVLKRLKDIFPFVCETQLELKNSKGAVLYHLFIICANPSKAAGNLAMRLAQSAVKLPRDSKR
ncbi:MAG: three-Cys-motif partner protein TcmP [Methylocystis sp.]|nr:three-Cys-motif partner protein TcmP [Methylocystis sp.]